MIYAGSNPVTDPPTVKRNVMKIDFTNENELLNLRLRYKNEYSVMEMLHEIENLQDEIEQLKREQCEDNDTHT